MCFTENSSPGAVTLLLDE